MGFCTHPVQLQEPNRQRKAGNEDVGGCSLVLGVTLSKSLNWQNFWKA